MIDNIIITIIIKSAMSQSLDFFYYLKLRLNFVSIVIIIIIICVIKHSLGSTGMLRRSPT